MVPLPTPDDGVPPVLTTPAEFADAARRLTDGHGPVALDTERASGFRYSGRAYLVQIRRAGTGTLLIDPIDHPDALDKVITALDGPEWVLHAADQDLPCLRELGFRCAELFDTELAGRLLGMERVNLATMVARCLGLGLAKGHGAADWSRRPLPDDWLNYAALDVAVLVELRDAVVADLTRAGKMDWARQEFESIRVRPDSTPRPDRWRRTSSIHTVKTARGLAIVRELWTERERIAAERDIAPGRVLPDSAMVAAAVASPASAADLTALPVFGGHRQRRRAGQWFAAIERARALPDNELPRRTAAGGGLPAPGRWAARNPEAAQRLSAVRAAVTRLSEQVHTPAENLLQPDLLRQICWDGFGDDAVTGALVTDEAVRTRLAAGGARTWQQDLTGPVIAAALRGDDATGLTG